MKNTPFLKTALAIFRKDVRAEMRSRELVSAMVLFTFLSILVFSFALELDRVVRSESVSGVLWVTLIFSSVLGFNRSLGMERDQGSMDALLISPIHRGAIFVGKFLSNYLFVFLVAIILIPLMTVLYNLPLTNFYIILTLFLGTFGLTLIGTLLATMTVQARSRETMLPIVMMPLALPTLLSAVNASTSILKNAPQETWMSWIMLLALLDIFFLVMCLFLFPFVIEE